jgi:Icc-related predicted phosphoesterase
LTIEGLKIWGSPITPWFYGDRWAFNKHRGEEINNVWNTIPNDTDVIITHGPPAKIRDFIPSSREYVGCSDLLHRIQVIQPKLVCFGHIHEGYGLHKIDETTFVNASICDANYDPTNKPVKIEL